MFLCNTYQGYNLCIQKYNLINVDQVLYVRYCSSIIVLILLKNNNNSFRDKRTSHVTRKILLLDLEVVMV